MEHRPAHRTRATRGRRGAGRLRRVLQLALFLAGTILFVALVRSIGAAQILAELRRFGWALLVIVALELVVDACNTLAWRRTVPPSVAVGFARLFWVRLAGTAINQLTPTATVGGEVVKASLLRPYAPTADLVASLIAARMSYAIGQAILVLVGLTALLARLRDAPELAFAVVGALVATLGGVLTFVMLQRRGVFAVVARVAGRAGLAAGLATRLEGGAVALDRELGAIYDGRPLAFAASVAWHVAAQLIGILQLWLIMTWLGSPLSVATCLAIEAFAVIIDAALFFVPARAGVQEGGRVLVFTTLGLPARTGLVVALIVRLTQLIVAACGLAALAWLSVPTAARRACSAGPELGTPHQ